MLKSNYLTFAPRQLAEDYEFNDIVERRIAGLVGELADETPVDFFNGVRTSHDWGYVGDGSKPMVKIELKTSNESEYPVELSKDKEKKIKSGIAATEADLVIILSNGRGAIQAGQQEGPTIGKMRIFTPRSLLAATAGREPFRYNGAKSTETAYVVKVNLTRINHWYIGDVEMVLAADGVTWMFDLEKFIPARKAQSMLRGLFQELREQKQERGN